jgi:hypothetical protein
VTTAGQRPPENIGDIEKAKLDAFNEINKRMDEKLQSSLRIFRFVVWSIVSAGLILIFAFGLWGYRGYKDIQKMVEASAKENAAKIIDAPEFQKKINNTLGVVVENKINDLDSLSKKLIELKNKISSSDSKQVVHNLFSDIEPRLVALEKLEKDRQIQVHEKAIHFFSDGKQIFSIQFGEKLMTKDDFKDLPVTFDGPIKKIVFEKPFSSRPQVFVQIDKNVDTIFAREKLQINSVTIEKDGFIISFFPVSRTADLKEQGIIRLSWLALGK